MIGLLFLLLFLGILFGGIIWERTPKISPAIIAQAEWIGTITCHLSQAEAFSPPTTRFEVYLYKHLVILSMSKELNLESHYILVTPQQWNDLSIKSPIQGTQVYLVQDVGFYSVTRKMVLIGEVFFYKNAIAHWWSSRVTRIEILEGDLKVLQQFEQLWENSIGDERHKYRSFGLDIEP